MWHGAIAQAAHWFNWEKFWPEVARVLRKDGTLAVWVRLWLGVIAYRLILHSLRSMEC